MFFSLSWFFNFLRMSELGQAGVLLVIIWTLPVRRYTMTFSWKNNENQFAQKLLRGMNAKTRALCQQIQMG